MINLTSIQTLVDQTIGTLTETVAMGESSNGVRDALERCIGTLKLISEDINDDAEKRPTFVQPFNRPEA